MRTLDLRGMIIPFVLLKASNAFKKIGTGETLKILLGDPDSMRDLLKILPPPSYELTAVKKIEDIEDDGTGFYIQLLKKQPENKNKEDVMSDVDLSTIKAENTVDARGSACPGPLLEAKKGIGKVKIGEILEIYSNDSGTRNDIPAWSKKVGHDYLGFLEVDGYDKHFVRRNK